MEPRVLRVERVFPNSFLQRRDYSWFETLFDNLVEGIKIRICGCFVDKQATFVMNQEMYKLFRSVAPVYKGPYWEGIYIKEDLTPECIPWNNDTKPKGRILLEYIEPVELTEIRINNMPFKNNEELKIKINRDSYGHTIQKIFYDEFIGLDHGNGFRRVPHIDHVVFNGPATIVFWEDGTKTVVKHDGKGRKDKRQAILYAFIRKIYGEGKPYHNILNEIEEAVK